MFPCGWTPDGKQLLVVHSLPDRTSRIAMATVDGGSVRVIKSVGWQGVNARLSPDGRFIAYDRPVDDKTNARDIFILAVDGSQETAVVVGPSNDTLPVWSADGSQLLFVSNRTELPSLWSIPIRNGRAAGAATLLQADFAGKRPLGLTRDGVLYYNARGAGGTNVYSAELDSSMKMAQPPRIAVDRFINSNLGGSVSSDGQYLAYYSGRPGRGLVIMVRNLKSNEDREIALKETVVSPWSSGPMWSADGGSLIVASRDPQKPGPLFLRVQVADGKTEPLLHIGPQQGFALSPDGKSLYYAEQDADSVPDKVGTRLVRYDFDSKGETVLKRGSWVISISVSPDSRQVAYLVSGRGSQEDGAPDRGSRLEVMPAWGGEARVIYRDTPWLDGSRYNGLAWSSDGRYLVFVRGGVTGNEPNSLWRISLTGGQLEQIGSMKGNIKNPHMGPGDRTIYFTASEPAPSELWALQNFLPNTTANGAR
jgi:Tol biopolymer transport system component